MALKFLKIVSFLQFFADVSNKFKAAIAIYAYVSESSRFALLKMLVIMLCVRFQKALEFEVDNFVKFLLSQYFF